MASQDNIEGLHRQIKSNAAVLFPKALEDFGGQEKEVAFEVVVVRAIFEPTQGHQYQAILMSGPQNARRDAANATARDTMLEALQSLADLTGEALHKKRMEGESDVTTDAQGQSKELETLESGWVSKNFS